SRLFKVIFHPLLPEVEENFAAIGVEVVGNENRAAEVVSELIVVNGSCNSCRKGIGVASPGIGVKRGIAEVLVSSAVELVSAGLGGDADLRAGTPAKFGSVIGGQNLDFLGGIHVGSADAGAVRTRTRAGGAIERDQIFRVARAVEIGGALR